MKSQPVPIIKKIVNRTIRLLGPKPKLPGKIHGIKVLSDIDANALLFNEIHSDQPFLVGRLGYSEMKCVMNHLRKHPDDDYNQDVIDQLRLWSGFFPTDCASLDRFAKCYTNAISASDILGVWLVPGFDYGVKIGAPKHILKIPALEPYFFEQPWSRALEHKKVLVIHPFADSIKHQYSQNRKSIFKDQNVLPEFDLITYKSVQSIVGQRTEYKSWFDALDKMKQDLVSLDFNIALIGAGAYGLPLGAYIKKDLERQAIHIGGALQILFGIKGNRWDDHPVIKQYYNASWIRPAKHEIPSQYKLAEGGSYW